MQTVCRKLTAYKKIKKMTGTNNIKKYFNIYEIAPAALTGLLLSASFPKAEIAPLAWVALLPLLFAIKGAPPGKSFRIGFAAGFVHYLSLLYWLVHTMKVYGNLPTALSVLVLFLLSAYLACYVAFFSALTSLCCKSRWLPLFLIPAFWVSVEYARFFLMPGFPWELLGYTQYRNLSFIQIADTLGVYGISFWIAFANAVFFLISIFLIKKRWFDKKKTDSPPCGGILHAALSHIIPFCFLRQMEGSLRG